MAQLKVTYKHNCGLGSDCTTPGLEVEHVYHIFEGNYVHLLPVHCVDTGAELLIKKRVRA